MTDKITITLTYSRKEILEWARKSKDLAAGLIQTRQFLNETYPAWSMDIQTSCMVELMFRDESDPFFEIYSIKLAELDPKKGYRYG